MKVIVTGGAGFIGSAVCRYLISNTTWSVVNFDKLTYAANLDSLRSISNSERYQFVQGDIASAPAVRNLIEHARPNAILNLAAESHVDRSIDAANDFINANIHGTFVLLEEARRYYSFLPPDAREAFRFHHISTDEVFGALGQTGTFKETTPYDPSSPYAASKAASDHLVRAWGRTYGLPVLISNCSNNYGPYQFPEKLVPLMILRALKGERLPVYGSGEHVRDWLYVEDHVVALITVLTRAKRGSTYNIGAACEQRNIDMVEAICELVDELAGPLPSGRRRVELISYVEDRPGHDKRYAIDASKIWAELGWRPTHDLATGLRRTVQWYLDNEDWWRGLVARHDVLGRQGLVK